VSVEGLGESCASEGAYVVTLKRDGGCWYGSDELFDGIETSLYLYLSRNCCSYESVDSCLVCCRVTSVGPGTCLRAKVLVACD
jgi:uncharacterized Fe-S cluster-containing MiaB family protein